MKSRWRQSARDCIKTTLLECEAQAALLGEPLDGKATFDQVNAAYPFVERRNHPYTIWLSEMKVVKKFLALNPPREARFYDCFSGQVAAEKFKRVELVAPGQTSLFG